MFKRQSSHPNPIRIWADSYNSQMMKNRVAPNTPDKITHAPPCGNKFSYSIGWSNPLDSHLPGKVVQIGKIHLDVLTVSSR